MPAEEIPYPAIDADEDLMFYFVGRKNSGKSQAAREHFRWWPGIDKLIIDVNHDVDPGDDLDVQWLPADPPLSLPERRDRDVPEVFQWSPDPARGSFRDDCDRALGLGLHPKDRRVLKWVDEAGKVFQVHRSGPNATTLANQNRHYGVPMLNCGPRALDVETLILSQSDRIFMFDVPSPRDRQRLADNMGIRPAELDRELDRRNNEMPEYSSLMFMAGPPDQRGLYLIPPFNIT
jgi:hypothetical protein